MTTTHGARRDEGTGMHERVSINALSFPGADMSEMAGNWEALGARRISFPGPLLGDDLPLARRIIADGGHQLETVSHLFLWGRGIDRDEATWSAGRDELSRVIDAVAELGGRSVYMMTGGRGHRGALTWEAAAERFSAGIAPCVAQAEAAGVRLAIEPAPALYAENHLPHTLKDTVLLAEMAGLDVCIDIYSSWTESGLEETFARAMPRCCLVQVSDYVYGDRSLPSRAVPGDGAIPLPQIIGWLLAAGYTGGFDLELIGPRIEREGCLAANRRAADEVGRILSAHNA